MADDRPRSFSWFDYLPWLRLGRALRTSLSIRVLLAAMIGYVGTKAGWRLIGMMFENENKQNKLQDYIALSKPWPWERPAIVDSPTVEGAEWVGHFLTGPLLRGWTDLSWPFKAMFDYQVGWTGFAYAILCGLWMLVVWSFFGGIITRTAAMRFARNETPSLGHCIRFTNRRYLSYFIAPLFPILGIVLAAIPLLLLGLIAQVDFGAMVSGILGFVLLLCGLFMAILFVALAVGWPLMWATISTEGTDSFDALSRMYAYVYQRPVKLLFYLIVAAILGVIGGLFVFLLASAVTLLSAWGFSLGSGQERLAMLVDYFDGGRSSTMELAEPEGMAEVGSNLLQFWYGIVFTIVASFPIAFLWCAYTGIYSLLRNDVDAAELDEVYLDEQQRTFGLPHLAADSAGVPLATDSTSSAIDRAEPQGMGEAAATDEENGDSES